MMYQELKLEKGMYHISGKSFSQVLEQADPSAQYADTPMEGLDAYERQLKRFEIHVAGPMCDRVEKFFSTTESAVLFPEFIRRAVRSGVEQSALSQVTAVNTQIEGGEYVGGVLSDKEAYSTKTTQGAALPTATYLESSTVMRLDKFGRAVHASYEAVRRQRLDAFGAVLRSIGVKLGNAILGQAILKLNAEAGSTVDVKTSGTLTYVDMTTLYGAFRDFDMTAVLASPKLAAQIMAMDQMKEMASAQPSRILLPFGAQLLKCAGMSDDYLIGLDQKFALEMVTGSDLILETDKLIDSQLDTIAMSIRVGFRVMTADAVHVLAM